MFILLCLTSTIVIIVTTIIFLLKKTRFCKYIYNSDRETQTDITNAKIQEIDKTSVELQQINLISTKQTTIIENLQKNIDVVHHNVLAQQALLEFLNKHTSDSLQTIVDVVHQLVPIVQNTHDSTQTLVHNIMKFQENTSNRILLSSELARRNVKILPIIEETTRKIHSILNELINSDQTPFKETTHSDDQMLDLDHNLSHAAEQNTLHSIEEQEKDYEYHQTNKTRVTTTPAPWDNLPYGCKTCSKAAFMRQKHRSLMKHTRKQNSSY